MQTLLEINLINYLSLRSVFIMEILIRDRVELFFSIVRFGFSLKRVLLVFCGNLNNAASQYLQYIYKLESRFWDDSFFNFQKKGFIIGFGLGLNWIGFGRKQHIWQGLGIRLVEKNLWFGTYGLLFLIKKKDFFTNFKWIILIKFIWSIKILS